MSKDQEFIKNSVRNDLRRVSKWTVEATGPLPKAKTQTFLQHARDEFSKLSDPHSQQLASELERLTEQLSDLTDPLQRLRWAEKVLTLSCRV